MNEIKLFENPDFGKIRIQMDASNEPLFCASDVCAALGYSNGRDAIAKHVDEEDVAKCDISTPIVSQGVDTGKTKTMLLTFVTESGLYSLVFGSKIATAKKFKKWVTSEVLPSIRKTGSYNMPNFANPAEAARAWADQYERNQALEVKNAAQAKQIEQKDTEIKAKDTEIVQLSTAITEMQPKVSYVDTILQCKDTVQTTIIAQDYGMSAKAFNILLRNLKIQRKVGTAWVIYGNYLAKGYVQSETFTYRHRDGSQGAGVYTKWTQKGRLFLYQVLKKHDILPLIEQPDNTTPTNK